MLWYVRDVLYIRSDNINIDKMINILLLKLSKEHDIFYMERRTYKDNKVYKSYIVNIDGNNAVYKNKKDLLINLSNY